MVFISHTEVGTVTSAIDASSGEIVNIITVTPTSVSSDVTIWLVVCCRLCGEVVDVVGDPAEQVAALLPVDVGERQPVELALDRLAQLEHRSLHHAGEQVRLAVRESTTTPK